jgi:DNA-binding MarR family transcriptional regulator
MRKTILAPKDNMQHQGAYALTGVVLAIFRSNGCLLEAGDGLVKDLGLTSARWQVMGALALADGPMTTPKIASAMGLTRQGVQKQLNVLVSEKFLDQIDNPKHKRSPVYVLSNLGKKTYAAANAKWVRWASQLNRVFSPGDLEVALRVLNQLNKGLKHQITNKSALPLRRSQ